MEMDPLPPQSCTLSTVQRIAKNPRHFSIVYLFIVILETVFSGCQRHVIHERKEAKSNLLRAEGRRHKLDILYLDRANKFRSHQARLKSELVCAGLSHDDVVVEIIMDICFSVGQLPVGWCWRNILRLRDSALALNKHEIRDRRNTFLWLDYRRPHGPLLNRFSSSIIMASGLHKKVKDWPKTRPRAILDIIAAVDGIVSPNPCRQILFFGSSKWNAIAENMEDGTKILLQQILLYVFSGALF
ncbi:hypothetical protein POUND7_018140 [Theobroma cacao]